MIPFIDLAAQQKIIYKKIQKRINDVLAHGQYVMGPEISELEERLAEFAGVKHAITCSSGTDALLMPLMAMGVGPGDAIFTTPFTFIATAEVIALLGATPVFVDIDSETFNIDPEKLELAIKALNEDNSDIHPLPYVPDLKLSPKGIIAVDLFGLPADYGRVNAVAEKHDLFVIEDAAQSFGAAYKGKQAGALADIGATSFFPAKPLACYGDGGAVFTDDDDMLEKLKSIRVHGMGKQKYDNVRVGINGRFDTLQAAILLEKLNIFPDEIEARNRVAEGYSKGLKGVLEIPRIPTESKSVWAQYSVLSENRKHVQDSLKKAEIPTAIYYPLPLHLQGAFSGLGYGKGDFPVCEDISDKIFSLPMHPYLENETVDRIVNVIQDVIKS